MIMRNRPEKDTVNPPGQIRYLRDVIRKYQEEEKEDRYPERHGTINKTQAIYPPDNAEKRLERLKQALRLAVDDAERMDGRVPTDRIMKIIEENT